MIRKVISLAAVSACFASTACTSYLPAVASTPQHAYIVAANGFLIPSMNMYLCDASGAKPVCKKIDEQ